MATAPPPNEVPAPVKGNGKSFYLSFVTNKRAIKHWRSFGPQAEDTIFPTEAPFKIEEKRARKQEIFAAIGTEIPAGPYYLQLKNENWGRVYFADTHYRPMYIKRDLPKELCFGGDDPTYWNLDVVFEPRPGTPGYALKNPVEPAKVRSRIEEVLVDPTSKTVWWGDALDNWLSLKDAKNVMHNEELNHQFMADHICVQLGVKQKSGDPRVFREQHSALDTMANACSTLSTLVRRSTRLKGPPKRFRTIGPFVTSPRKRQTRAMTTKAKNKSSGPNTKKAKPSVKQPKPTKPARRQVKKKLNFPGSTRKNKQGPKSKSQTVHLATSGTQSLNVFLQRELNVRELQDNWDSETYDAVQGALQVHNVLEDSTAGRDMFLALLNACPAEDLQTITKMFHQQAVKAAQNVRKKFARKLANGPKKKHRKPKYKALPQPDVCDLTGDASPGKSAKTKPAGPGKSAKKNPAGPGKSAKKKPAGPVQIELVTPAGPNELEPPAARSSDVGPNDVEPAAALTSDAGPNASETPAALSAEEIAKRGWITSTRSKSGYKGVILCQRNKTTPARWRAKVAGHTLGRYATMAEACDRVALQFAERDVFKKLEQQEKDDDECPLSMWADEIQNM